MIKLTITYLILSALFLIWGYKSFNWEVLTYLIEYRHWGRIFGFGAIFFGGSAGFAYLALAQ